MKRSKGKKNLDESISDDDEEKLKSNKKRSKKTNMNPIINNSNNNTQVAQKNPFQSADEDTSEITLKQQSSILDENDFNQFITDLASILESCEKKPQYFDKII